MLRRGVDRREGGRGSHATRKGGKGDGSLFNRPEEETAAGGPFFDVCFLGRRFVRDGLLLKRVEPFEQQRRIPGTDFASGTIGTRINRRAEKRMDALRN